MNITQLKSSLAFAALASCTIGCGSPFGAAPLQPAAHSLTSASRLPVLVYVSDQKNNLIDVFDEKGTLLSTITTGVKAPVGLFVDAQHNLWVANPGANDVLEFARGATAPSRRLRDRNLPNDVTVCGNGTAFVADTANIGGIGVYPPGRDRPARRLLAVGSDGGGPAFYVTCDATGNIFATGFVGFSPYPATMVWRRGRESGWHLLPQATWSTNGIKVTAARTLLISTIAGSHAVIEKFTEDGNATGREMLTGSIWSDIALNAQQGVVFGTDTRQGVVVAREFPRGTIRHTYSNANLAQPAGVAVDPGD